MVSVRTTTSCAVNVASYRTYGLISVFLLSLFSESFLSLLARGYAVLYGKRKSKVFYLFSNIEFYIGIALYR